jgi:hypothetical protein
MVKLNDYILGIHATTVDYELLLKLEFNSSCFSAALLALILASALFLETGREMGL